MLQACDLVVAAEDARFGDQHANFWLIPGGGGSQRLPCLIGVPRVKELLLSGRWLTRKEAASMGLILPAVPAEKLDEAVGELVEALQAKNPAVLRHMKQLANAYKYAAQKGSDLEVALFQRHIVSAAAREGLAAFRERRPPRFPAGNSGTKETIPGRSDR